MTDYLEINSKTNLSEISFDGSFSKFDTNKKTVFDYKIN